MSADTDRLMKNARIRLPGATDVAILNELYNVFNEFFQESGVWKEEIDFPVLSTDTTDTTYTLTPASATTTIHRLDGVVNSDDITVGATMQIPGEVTLANPPGRDDTYTATVVLTVNGLVGATDYPEFPTWTLHRYEMGILDGLLGRMMSQPAKPFTNLQLGAYHQRKFRSAISIASSESLRKNLSNAQAWRFPRNFA
jgi:hypothetical protein